MNVKRNFVQNCFNQAIEVFEDKVMKLPVNIEVEFVDIEDFIEYAENSEIVRLQKKMGIYKDIKKEFVSCMCVVDKNKNPMRQIMGLPYIVTVSMDITKRILKPYNKKQCEEYLIHGFIHEFTHLFEPMIIQSKSDEWNECLKQANDNTELAKELLAERIADLIDIDQKAHDQIQQEIWKPIYDRMQKIQRNRGRV